MRLLMQTCLLVWWGLLKHTRADNFAAVSGTGWTDISQLQSTCSVPGYFVNPSDCTRFYVCVDHSTAEKSLLLRYDFDCPGGLAFDESTRNCNYPGPTGCVSGGGGGGGSGGWGWSKQPGAGIFQSTATVSRQPNSWGTPTKYPVSTTVIQRPSSGGTIVRVSSTPAPVASNPTVNLPSTHVVRIPVTAWESLRLRPSYGVFQSAKISGGSSTESGGWSPQRMVTSSPGVFQSARVTTQAGQSASVPWGASKILPIEPSPGVFQSARVTPVPHTEWETPRPFPQPAHPVKVVQETGSGWAGVRITQTPAPAYPVVHNVTPSPPLVWQSQRISPPSTPPAVSWQGITQVHQQQPAPLGWSAPLPANPSLNFAPQNPPVASNPTLNYIQAGGPVPSNPSLNYIQAGGPVPSNPSHNYIQAGGPVPSNPQNYIQAGGPVASNPTLNYVQASPPIASNPSVTYYQGSSQATNYPSVNYIQNSPPVASNPSLNFIQSNPPPAGNPPQNYIHSNAQAEINQENNGPSSIQAVHANPTVSIPAGWENNVRITPLPSGYIWQSVPNGRSAQSENYVSSTPVAPTLPSPPVSSNSLQSGDYGIVQQVINEEQGQNNVDGKSHIQLVYERKEEQLGQNGQYQSQSAENQNQEGNQNQEISGNDPSNPIYQVFASPDSGKGRIIVLYAPLSRGGKREVPTIEVEVEDGDGDDNSEGTENA